MEIVEVGTDAEVESCWAVMAELRPHVARGEFVERVRRQRAEGYRLACVRDVDAAGGGRVVCCAGFRVFENLAGGRHLYVDDLVSAASERSKGHGRAMLEWLAKTARAEGCVRLELDSGVQRFGAHRFYLREGFDIVSHHFRRML